jgi:transcriptional regulator with XRE-family HTH domain
MIESPFGNLLNTHRERKKLKLETLAEKADVSSSYISLLIRGKKGRPSDRIIEQLSQALDLTEDEKLEFQAAAEVSRVDNSPTKLDLPDEAGLEAVHRSLSDDLLREYFGKAEKLVRIQDNGLQDLLTYNSRFRELLKRAKPDLVIKILLLDPNSALAKIREEALDMPKEMGYLHHQIKSAIRVFEDIHKDVYREYGRKHIEMRLFTVLPSVQHIAFDDTIFIGFYTHTAPSQSAYQLQIKRSSELGYFFEQDFDRVWEMATPYILEP